MRFKYRPYPLRPDDALPTPKELQSVIKELERAKKEPEGAALKPDLWTGVDLPRSSVPALAALEAARMQGPEAVGSLARANDLDARLGAGPQRPDGPAGVAAVDQQLVPVAGDQRRDHGRMPGLGDEPDVADQRLVEDRVERLRVVVGPGPGLA